MIPLQTYRWGGRAALAVDDQPAPGHSCRRSLCLSVLLQAVGLPYSGQVHKASLINSYFWKSFLIQQTQKGSQNLFNEQWSWVLIFFPLHAACQKSSLHLLAFNIVLCHMECEPYPLCMCVFVCPALQSKNNWWWCGSAGWSKKRNTLRGKKNFYIHDNGALLNRHYYMGKVCFLYSMSKWTESKCSCIKICLLTSWLH